MLYSVSYVYGIHNSLYKKRINGLDLKQLYMGTFQLFLVISCRLLMFEILLFNLVCIVYSMRYAVSPVATFTNMV